MKKVLLLVAVLGLAFGIAVPDSQATLPGPGSVVGKVLDAAGNPVGGATVVLHNAGGVVNKTTTDRAGHFSFRKVRPGKYGIRAGKRGVGKDAKRIRVRRDTTTRVRLVLQ